MAEISLLSVLRDLREHPTQTFCSVPSRLEYLFLHRATNRAWRMIGVPKESNGVRDVLRAGNIQIEKIFGINFQKIEKSYPISNYFLSNIHALRKYFHK